MTRVLLLAVAMLLPAASEAAGVSLIVGGWSHHFVSAAERDALNQNQGTVGIELSTPTWTIQASRMTDSFGCGAKEVAAAGRWELFASSSWLRSGLMVAATAADRCSTFPTPATRQVVIGETGPTLPPGWAHLAPGVTAKCPYVDSYHVDCTFYGTQVIGETESRRWYLGVLPGVYLDIGDRVQAELSLVRSPWTGHHLVLYGQVSVKVFSF